MIGIEEGARWWRAARASAMGSNAAITCKPTVFANVNPSMTIAREEIFGPVLAIMPYRDEEEAIAIANDTPYGLAAYVQSGDQERARRVAMQMRAGSVYVNYPAWDPGSPFGGYKQSGNGREYGEWGLEAFLEVKGIVGYGGAYCLERSVTACDGRFVFSPGMRRAAQRIRHAFRDHDRRHVRVGARNRRHQRCVAHVQSFDAIDRAARIGHGQRIVRGTHAARPRRMPRAAHRTLDELRHRVIVGEQFVDGHALRHDALDQRAAQRSGDIEQRAQRAALHRIPCSRHGHARHARRIARRKNHVAMRVHRGDREA